MKTVSISARIDKNTKEEVENIFSNLGLNASQAISIFLNQVRLRKGIPFDVKLPKEANRATKNSLKDNKLTKHKSSKELYKDLDI